MTNDELILRRQQLLVRSAELRISVSGQLQAFKTPLSVADHAREGLQWMLRNPQWPLGALCVVIILRPRVVWRWGGRIWWAWKTYQQTRRMMESISFSETHTRP